MKFSKTTMLRAVMLASAGMAGMAAPGLSKPVKAQALQPVVDVCTGISLDDSVLTDILTTTVVPTATGVERLFDELIDLELTVGLLTIDLLDIPDVDLGIAQTTSAIASGDTISLQVLDENGNIVSPGDCNITADGYALNDAAGLAIGGNQITGLGGGLVASAGELDAIALGNNASTAAGATGAIALGTDASATAANSVALGAGSVADRGPQLGYTPTLMTGTFDSVGSVSVGAAGALRQITNVAPGSAPSDAATVGQVQAAIDSVNGAVANAVQYDSAAQDSVTLAGTGGTVIANVADGEVSAASDEAVNGSQLFATNQQVDANTGNITNLQTDVTANTTAIGDLEVDVAANTTAIGDLEVDVATNTTDIAALQDSAVMYDDAGKTSITLEGTGGTTITNVAAGTLDAASTDAVNGSQLFATNQQVATNTVSIQNNADAIAAISTTGDPLGVAYDDTSRSQVTFDGADGTVLANVAAGEVSATSDEAVNGSQLFATNQAVDDLDGRVTTNEGDIVSLDNRVTVNETDIANLDGRVTTNEGDIVSLDNRVTVNETDIANLDSRVTVNEGDISDNSTSIANLDTRVTVNEGDISDNTTSIANLDGRVTVNEGDITDNRTSIANMDGRVTVNETAITNVQQQIANVPVGYVDDDDTSTSSDTATNTAAFASADGGAVRVTNVAQGNVAAGSTDAVNGAQLAATNAAVAMNRSDIDDNTAAIDTINTNLQGSTVVAVQYSDPANPTQSNGGVITNDVTLVGANVAEPVRLHNVANGTLANDAVNLGQLQSGLAGAMSTSMAYTDQQFGLLSDGLDRLSFDLEEARDEAFAGTAGAMAVAGIPQTMEPGRSMFGGAIGHYRGETAFAIGVSTTFNDGKAVVKAGGTLDTDGRGGFSAGAGFSF